jgi:hypothetical protein
MLTMQFCGRAYYNLLIMNPEACCGLDVESWQSENYRKLSDDDLYDILNTLGITLDDKHLSSLVEQCASPEELVSCLPDVSEESFENAYLVLFELWRRNFSEKQSLSIFCDQLDNTIEKYHKEVIDSEELVETIAELERVLDDNSDHGIEPKEAFASVGFHMAHDLESFLFDFITLQIESRNEQYASELIEDFYAYVTRDHWFDFLRVRLTAQLDSEGASYMLSHLIDKLEEKRDKELLFEALEFIIGFGESASYMSIFSMLIELVNTQDEYADLLNITSNYFSFYSLNVAEIEGIAKKVSRRKRETAVSEKDRNQLREITSTGLKSI